MGMGMVRCDFLGEEDAVRRLGGRGMYTVAVLACYSPGRTTDGAALGVLTVWEFDWLSARVR